MADKNMAKQKAWPAAVGEDEDLYAVVDATDDTVKYLVFTSQEKGLNVVRDSGTWIPVSDPFFETIDDPDLYNEDVDIKFIDYYDNAVKDGGSAKVSESSKAMTAAAEDDKCPPATQDIKINLRNRRKAIAIAGYGPLNPAEENAAFWEEKATLWSITSDEAKQSLCGNCAVFVISDRMKNCIASGLEQGGSGSSDAWGAIDQAELGYCEAFDFKCASSRTCDAWVAGGPLVNDIK